MLKKLLNSWKIRRVRRAFGEADYLEAYARHTDAKAEIDPKMAIGGLWEGMGQHQFDFLVQQGLNPGHTLLDIGCGSLRGGLRFIGYLDEGNYWGFDISERVIEAGKKMIIEHALEEKRPTIFVNHSRQLSFKDFGEMSFDYVLAQSVFSHLKPEHIRECFENLPRVLKQNGRFFFTFHPGTTYRERSLTDFEYPFSFFENVASVTGFVLEDLSDLYAHPRGQRMMLATRQPWSA